MSVQNFGAVEFCVVLTLSELHLQIWKAKCWLTYTKATRLSPQEKCCILPSKAGYLEVFIFPSMTDFIFLSLSAKPLSF